MKCYKLYLVAIATIVISVTACSSPPRNMCGSGFRENSVKVRQGNPDRIDFDVCGDPYPFSTLSIEEQKLPNNLQFRLVMKAYASKRLPELQLCPYGFNGPDSVMGPRYDYLKRVFFVDCLPKQQ